MKDKNGKELNIGDRVLFQYYGWRNGTIRDIAEGGVFAGLYRVDDGDHDNCDIASNHFSITMWIKSSKIKKRVEK